MSNARTIPAATPSAIAAMGAIRLPASSVFSAKSLALLALFR